jgi:periplasmic divalent cation tolerance protein
MGEADDVMLVYVTAADEEQAARIARAAVEARLAACANLLGGIHSIYRWEGRVEDGREVALLLKTRRSLLEALTALIKKAHSYACPCIVAWPIAGGHPAFLAWVRAETADDAPADAGAADIPLPPPPSV